MRNEALHPLRNPDRKSTMKTVKQIATSLLAGAVLQCSCAAGPATGTWRPAPAVSGMPEKKSVQRYQYAIIKEPSHSVGQAVAFHQFNAGENSFTLGDDWFRD